jgi:hypothetical protein
MNRPSLSRALGTITPAINEILDVYAPSMPSVWEPLYTIEWRVMGTAANFKSLTIHDIVEAIFAEDLLMPLAPAILNNRCGFFDRTYLSPSTYA